MKTIAEVVQVKEAVEDSLLKLPGVTGVDVGYKEVGGKPTGEVAIRVLVAQKKPPKSVPEDQQIPPEINGVKTDVIERRFVLHQRNRVRVKDIALQADTTHYASLKGGISIGPCRAVNGYVYAGTLGAVVKDNTTGQTMLLSNFHVMCIDNGWHVGDQMTQPSRVDTGSCPSDVVGTLQRAVLSASVDGAICSVSARTTACEIQEIGAVTGTAAAALNMAVRKRGRTTGLTYGTVDSISLSVKIDYGDGLGERTLTNQIGVKPDPAHNAKFGDHGDSGSVIVNAACEVVGLHFAGDDSGYGIANPIASVLSELNITLCVAPSKTKPEIKEIKDHKIEKLEIKEHKLEKFELKDHKNEKFEFEQLKRIPEFPKLFEVPGIPEQPGIPPFPGSSFGATSGILEQRMAHLEAAMGQLSLFITSAMRPDLGAGALAKEGDLSQSDVTGLSQQLAKEAADAVRAKANFDNKLTDR